MQHLRQQMTLKRRFPAHYIPPYIRSRCTTPQMLYPSQPNVFLVNPPLSNLSALSSSHFPA
ncbi:hypothetical protein BegalDRAFT_3465 [Beggiatoa alba B18LD]|uniref:Uncharacterized protein n=1 Tax=Beggiatoa alba B18LD TaxID=395493 RepID=I3CKY6_9GAMM|nr:hypothetical protein BegalDRAFT_3465 [Beggiatoa alba B18LD]